LLWIDLNWFEGYDLKVCSFSGEFGRTGKVKGRRPTPLVTSILLDMLKSLVASWKIMNTWNCNTTRLLVK
jgi:hypothetical protein